MSENHRDDDQTRTHIPLLKDTMVGHYRIVDKIGAGGMGEVYLAEDTQLDRKVALKFLPVHLCQDEDCRTRFKREAQAAAKLNHPNIIHVYEVSEYRHRPFFAMELVEGRSLREFSKDRDIAIDKIIEIVIQVCEGLQHAHENGVTHRDIKPSNILIDSHGRAKIVDFGLASVTGADQLTKTGSTVGTMGYMSPEQIGGKGIDSRSDLFSLGVVLYEMITRHSPFRRDSEAATLKAILEDTPEPLARFKSDLPEGLQTVIDKALEKDVQTRYQTSAELRADLKRILGSRAGLDRRHRSPKPRSRTVIGFGLIAVAILAAAVVLTRFFGGQESVRQPPRYVRLTTSGDIRNGALSPDGEFYVYARRTADRKEKFYVREINGGNPVEVFECDRWNYFDWSRDGSEILVQTSDPEGEWACLVPRLGGQVRKYKIPNLRVCLSHDGSRIISALPDDGLLYFIDVRSRDTSSVAVGGLAGLDELFGCSPDGKWLLASSWTSATGYRLLAIAVDGSATESIHEGLCFSAVWKPTGDHVYVLTWGPDNPELIRIPFDSDHGTANGEPVMVSTDVGQGGISISNDGRRMMIARGNRSCDLWRVELGADRDPADPHVTRLTRTTLLNLHPSVSPDGNQIAFTSILDVGADLYVIPAIGGERKQLTYSDRVNASPEWSPDGNKLIYFSVKDFDAKDVAWSVMDLTDGSTKRLPFNFDTAKADCGGITTTQWWPADLVVLSACGLLFIDPSTGEFVPMPGVPEDRDITSAYYNPDASALAVHWNREDPRMDGIWIIPLDKRPERFVARIDPDANIMGWGPDGKWIYFWGKTDAGTFEIRRVENRSGKTELLAVLTVEPQQSILMMDLAPDATWAVFSKWDQPLDLWMVENFDPYAE